MARSKSDRVVRPVFGNPEEQSGSASAVDADAADVVAESHALASGTFFSFDCGESFAAPSRLSERPKSRRTTCPLCGCEGTGGFRCEDCADDADAHAKAERLALASNPCATCYDCDSHNEAELGCESECDGAPHVAIYDRIGDVPGNS